EPAGYAGQLLQRSRTGFMLLDHGFGGDVLGVEEHRAAVPIPQLEVVRLETLAEALVERHRHVEDWLDGVRSALARAVAGGAVGVKTIAGYRASLRLRWPDARAVRAEYSALRQRRRAGPVRLV